MLTAIIIVFILAGTVTYLIVKNGMVCREEQLYSVYQKALTGTDKEAAVRAGQAYYRYIKNKKLSYFDEQAIVKDLMRMN
ncbi:hypothetical protein FHK02_3668 [Spirosoma sp. LMG 31448]|uniref:Uncharacterized protein n=1 Tax=Spirosoma utsteinense TaxID=2585773 RepID=A0ABR6WER3_9BACT|nr:hypothetical protein [Spirosoma utsteinense]MBC3795046.1 hypothetical protein [Spirosoma utsteinense]